MPPPQRLLGPRIQGFICRSCLSKLQSPRNQRPPWLSRSTASENGPLKNKQPKSKKGSHDKSAKESEPVIRVWDETPDGVRIERGNEPGDGAILKKLESTIQDVRAEMAAEAETEDIDEGELQDRVLDRHMEDMVEGKDMVDFLADEMESQMKEIDADVDRRLEMMHAENMEEEEQFKVRNELFELVMKEKASTNPLFLALNIFTDISIDQPDSPPFPSPQPTSQESPPQDHEFPSDIQEQLQILIDALRSATTLLDQGRLSRPAALEIWNAYSLCRKTFISNPEKVPGEVWETLWNIFADKKTLNYRYLKLLGQDMTDAGIPLQNWQRLVHIQAVFADNEHDFAIKLWEDCEATLGKDSNTAREYWEVGCRMYSRNGQPDRAVGAAEALIQSTKDPNDFRTLIPIMKAFLHSEQPKRRQKAWALYMRLKVGLGPQMEMKDFDNVISAFFADDQPNLALAVFRDMMLTGDASARQNDFTAIDENGPLAKDGRQFMAITEKEHAWDDTRALAELPARFNNKFFFGKWLKKLIGDGEYDASIKVFNLMHERGIRADPKYVNGLIGAWLRTGKEKYHKLAEDTAWRMIEARLEYVEQRDTRPVLSHPLRPVTINDKPGSKRIFHHPAATIETFSVLVEDYRRRQRHDRMKNLMKSLEHARIQPNTFFMNQLMMVDSKFPKYHAWDTYTSLTRTQGVHPDFNTFGYLWHLTKKAVDPNLNPAQLPKVIEDVPNTDVPRLMISEMVKWMRQLNRRERLPRELYDMIILTFSLNQDHPGTAIVLHLLQRYFHMFPNEDTVRTIVLQLARTGLNSEEPHSQRRRLGVRKSPVVKDRVVQVTKLLEGFKERRVDELLKKGIVFEELSGDVRLEESVVVMTKLLRHVTEIRMDEGQDVDDIFEAAGKAMGASDCVPSPTV